MSDQENSPLIVDFSKAENVFAENTNLGFKDDSVIVTIMHLSNHIETSTTKVDKFTASHRLYFTRQHFEQFIKLAGDALAQDAERRKTK